ncbi:hypothetical protein AB0J52_41775, partial [Spirillospora sp. NPDC049652]
PAEPHVAPGDLDAATTGPLPIQADAPDPGATGLFAAPVPPGPADGERSPESLRSMLSAMQAGWQRGRADAADTAPSGNPLPGAAPAAGPTPAGSPDDPDTPDTPGNGPSGTEARPGARAPRTDSAAPRTDSAAPRTDSAAARPPDAAPTRAAGREDANPPAAPTGPPEPTTPSDQEDQIP